MTQAFLILDTTLMTKYFYVIEEYVYAHIFLFNIHHFPQDIRSIEGTILRLKHLVRIRKNVSFVKFRITLKKKKN